MDDNLKESFENVCKKIGGQYNERKDGKMLSCSVVDIEEQVSTIDFVPELDSAKAHSGDLSAKIEDVEKIVVISSEDKPDKSLEVRGEDGNWINLFGGY